MSPWLQATSALGDPRYPPCRPQLSVHPGGNKLSPERNATRIPPPPGRLLFSAELVICRGNFLPDINHEDIQVILKIKVIIFTES